MKQCGKCQVIWPNHFTHCGSCGIPVYERHMPAQKSITAGQVGIIILLSSAAIFVMAIGNFGGSSRSGSASLAVTPPSESITADRLYEEFEANEVRAEGRYKGKRYRISGTVADIGTDILGSPYVILATAKGRQAVQCSFERDMKNRLALLDKGEAFAANCEVSTKMIYVQARDCSQ